MSDALIDKCIEIINRWVWQTVDGKDSGKIKAIEELEALKGSGWQDISTAPKDGTPVMFFQKGNPNASNAKARKDGIRIDSFQSRVCSRYFYRELPEARYTHWMPLPEPPKQGGQG